MARVFEWVDAWVFAALRGADDESGQVDFSRLIAAADVLNHTIVTAHEVRRALAKLRASDLVEVRDARVTTTPLVSALHEQVAGRRGGAFSIVDNALGVLNSRRTRLPVVKTTADTAFVSDAFMKRANERYVKSVSA